MPASRAVRPSLPIALLVATLAIVLVCAAPALGQRGGRGGGRSGGPAAGPGQRPAGPAAGGVQQPGRGGQMPGPGGPGHVGGAGPQSPGVGRPGVGGPGAAGPGVGAPGAAGPVERRDVEAFLGAKPASAQAHATSVQAALSGRTQPFTASWYAEHPNAWQYTHPYANWWAIGGAVGICRWLAVPAPVTTSAATTTAPVATTSGTASDGAASPAPPADLEWMPLGVFATAPRGAGQAHAYQQLAVSRTGELKGNYYDAVTDAVQPIAGSIDRDTRRATWTVGKGSRFETTLDALLEPPGEARMTAGSVTQTWELVPMEKPAPSTAKP